ncbi:MAG: VTT domain-containing protein [Pirellulaceae bacterium]|nr:VTT domain-containing protein [Pirellulaceae bacterium]MDP7018689.1 VTT domain-containing protein [Pirellulaceae bacterium]
MQTVYKQLIIFTVVLALPVVPFLLFSEPLEAWVREWIETPSGRGSTSTGIIALLASDIFLPIPSSMISTMGGWYLGSWLGTLTSWVGMTLGAVIGFAMARRYGRPWAARFASEQELARMAQLSERHGAAILVFSRGLPLMAEASVLMLGVNQLPWRKFLPAVAVSNLVIAFVYSRFGEFAEGRDWLPLAIGVSIALPVAATTIGRMMLKND